MQTFNEKNYSFRDDAMFASVLASREDLSREMLEMILEKPIDHVSPVNARDILSFSPAADCVRFDVFWKDGSVSDVKLLLRSQREDFPAETAWDLAYASYGEDALIFRESGLRKEITVIMITLYDPFGKGLGKYSAKMTCQENPLIRFSGGMEVIFLDAGTPVDTGVFLSSDLKSLLDFIGGRHPIPTPLTEALEREAEKLNENTGWRKLAAWEEKKLQKVREEEQEKFVFRLLDLKLKDKTILRYVPECTPAALLKYRRAWQAQRTQQEEEPIPFSEG